MRNSKGITMITLVVTIVVLVILSSIVVQVGLEAYETVKVQNFISKMKVIQGKVDEISEMSDKSNVIRYLNPVEDKSKFACSGELEDGKTYYSVSKEEAKNVLGLKDIDIDVIIDFDNRKVISQTGIDVDGTTYYTQYDLNGGEKINLTN